MAIRRKRGSAAEIKDFASFIQVLDAGLEAAPRAAREGSAGGTDEGILFYAETDRPVAIMIRPGSLPSQETAAVGLVRAAVAFLAGNGRQLRELAASGTGLRDDYRGYLVFAGTQEGGPRFLFDPRLQAILLARLEETGTEALSEALSSALVAAGAAALAAAGETRSGQETRSVAPRLTIEDPASACASRFLFPAAFRSGETRFRFTPRSVGRFGGTSPAGAVYAETESPDTVSAERETGAEGEAGRECWFRFGIRSPTLSLGGFWVFRRVEGMPADRFKSLAATTAKLASGALAQEFRRAGMEASAAASPVPRPEFGARGACSLEGTVAAGYLCFDVRSIIPEGYLPSIRSALGGDLPPTAGPPPTAPMPSSTDPIAAFLLLGLNLRDRNDAVALEELVEECPGGEAGGTDRTCRFVPFHAALGLLPEDDQRRVVQNFLLREVPAESLARLFFYRKTVIAEGKPRRVVVKPQAFDLGRFVGLLPREAAQTFIASIREGESSETVDAFISRNDGIFRELVADLRRGSHVLHPRSERILAGIHLRFVYPRSRDRLDRMIEDDHPLAALRALPPRIFRFLVDRSDAAELAPAFIGREAAIDTLARWCSKRKLSSIQEEARRLGLLLSRGEADCDGLCERREALVKTARKIAEAERAERQRSQQEPG